MDYETTFSAILDLRSYDDSVLRLADAFDYEIVERNLVGEPRGKVRKIAWVENRLVFAVRPDVTEYVESVVAEVADRAVALSAPILATFKKCHPWLIVQLLDSKFVELHFDHDNVPKLAEVGLAVSVENRT